MFYSFAFLRYCITLNSVPGGGVVVVVVLAVVSFIISDLLPFFPPDVECAFI